MDNLRYSFLISLNIHATRIRIPWLIYNAVTIFIHSQPFKATLSIDRENRVVPEWEIIIVWLYLLLTENSFNFGIENRE